MDITMAPTETYTSFNDIEQGIHYILSMHDKALLQSIQLHVYTEMLTTRARNSMLTGNQGRALLLMKRRCIADGLKHMYCLYQRRKCQQLVSILSLTFPNLHEDVIIRDLEPMTRREEKQVEKFAQTMMVAQCSLSRAD